MEEKREIFLASTHTENFCTSYHGNINLEEKEQALGDFHPKAFLKGKCPEAHPERKSQANGSVQTPDTRCACTSWTYSPGKQENHCLTPLAQPSWPLTAHLSGPQQSPWFMKTSQCCTHPCSKRANPLQHPGIPESLILVVLFQIFFDPSGAGPWP